MGADFNDGHESAWNSIGKMADGEEVFARPYDGSDAPPPDPDWSNIQQKELFDSAPELRNARYLEAFRQFIQEGEAIGRAQFQGQPKEIPIMVNILLMFGPGHGQTMQLPEDLCAKQIVWQEPTDFAFDQASTFGNPYGLPSKKKIHAYQKMEEFSSPNMEDCILYAHHDDCCDKPWMGDGQEDRANERNRSRVKARVMRSGGPLYTNKDGQRY